MIPKGERIMQITDIVPGLAAGVGVRLSPNGKTAYTSSGR
jgi:hypothetical protein